MEDSINIQQSIDYANHVTFIVDLDIVVKWMDNNKKIILNRH